MNKRINTRHLRASLRQKGYKIYPFRNKAIRMAKELHKDTGLPFWVTREDYGYLVWSFEIVRAVNKTLMKQGEKPIRIRDLDRKCVFKTGNYLQYTVNKK